jgi:hypothetical protein
LTSPTSGSSPALIHRPLIFDIHSLLEKKEYHDVEFVLQDDDGQEVVISAIKVILAARSDQLATMLRWGPSTEDVLPAGQGEGGEGRSQPSDEEATAQAPPRMRLRLREVDPRTFRHVLHFIHTDELPADVPTLAPRTEYMEQLLALYKAADYFWMDNLKDLVKDQLRRCVLNSPASPADLLDRMLVVEREKRFEFGFGGDFTKAFASSIEVPNLVATMEHVLCCKSKEPESALVESCLQACQTALACHGRALLANLKTSQRDQLLGMSREALEMVLACSNMVNVDEFDLFLILHYWWSRGQPRRQDEADKEEEEEQEGEDAEVDKKAKADLVLQELMSHIRLQLITSHQLATGVDQIGVVPVVALKDALTFSIMHQRVVITDVREAKTPLHSASSRHNDLEWGLLVNMTDISQLSVSLSLMTNSGSASLAGANMWVYVNREHRGTKHFTKEERLDSTGVRATFGPFPSSSSTLTVFVYLPPYCRRGS